MYSRLTPVKGSSPCATGGFGFGSTTGLLLGVTTVTLTGGTVCSTGGLGLSTGGCTTGGLTSGRRTTGGVTTGGVSRTGHAEAVAGHVLSQSSLPGFPS